MGRSNTAVSVEAEGGVNLDSFLVGGTRFKSLTADSFVQVVVEVVETVVEEEERWVGEGG